VGDPRSGMAPHCQSRPKPRSGSAAASSDIRIGINSGEVMIGRISGDLSMDCTALGHDVGVAQTMERLAEPRHICLREHTARLVEGYF